MFDVRRRSEICDFVLARSHPLSHKCSGMEIKMKTKRKTEKKAVIRKITSVIVTVALAVSLLPARAFAAYEICGTCQVQADDGPVYTVKSLDYGYVNNTYFSLRDTAMVLKDTDKAFSLGVTSNSVSLTTGNAYIPSGTENEPWESEENPDLSLRRYEFAVNEEKVSYYTMIMKMPSGDYDCFMMITDLAMLLDVDLAVSDTGSLLIRTQEPFCASPEELEEAGYFYGVNSVLAGDATTGEIYYRYQSDDVYPIASTSKLMTCLLTMDAIAAGQIGLEESVIISEAAERLADSSDGVIPLKAGEEITVQDLLLGLLLPSSNECALCLAEAIAGSEEAFVEMMNRKAQELGLSRAVFFNSNGLPVYTEDSMPAKRQNRMSAEDMFRLASYLLKVYPQITDITSQKEAKLQYLDFEARNSNPLLHNMSGITGLKTGTTNKAGACLVTSLSADDGTMEHDLIVVVLGTEDSIERGRVSELLARYALQAFSEGGGASAAAEGTVRDLPVHAEAAVELVIRGALRKGE